MLEDQLYEPVIVQVCVTWVTFVDGFIWLHNVKHFMLQGFFTLPLLLYLGVFFSSWLKFKVKWFFEGQNWGMLEDLFQSLILCSGRL